MNKNWFATIVLFLTLAVVSAQNMPVLYDPNLKSKNPVQLESQVLSDVFTSAAKSQKDFCAGKLPSASGIKLSGSFTRAHSNQVAYVVLGCTTNDETIFYLASYESSALLNLYRLIVPGKLREAYAIKDINTNNLSELAFVYDWEDGCDGVCTFKNLDIAEFKNSNLISKTSLIVERGGGILDEYRFNYTVYVSRGSTPLFVGVDSSKPSILTKLDGPGYPGYFLRISKIK
jgi:hypothetical protein